MASSDKTEADAKRASTRGFGGYLLDRATGRADFKKDAGPGSAAAASPLGVNKTRRQGVTDDAYAAGGLKEYSKEYKMSSPAGRNVHEGYAAGGMVRRGFGKARGA